MTLRLRCVGAVDPRLRAELIGGFRWIRKTYSFPLPVEVRLVHAARIADFDGVRCALRWWHSTNETFVGEIAVGSFARNFEREGPGVAFPTVVAAVGRVLKYSFQSASGAPLREDYVGSWGDKFLDAYLDDSVRPPPPYGRGRVAPIRRRRSPRRR